MAKVDLLLQKVEEVRCQFVEMVRDMKMENASSNYEHPFHWSKLTRDHDKIYIPVECSTGINFKCDDKLFIVVGKILDGDGDNLEKRIVSVSKNTVSVLFSKYEDTHHIEFSIIVIIGDTIYGKCVSYYWADAYEDDDMMTEIDDWHKFFDDTVEKMKSRFTSI